MTIEFPGEPEEKVLVYFLLILLCLFTLLFVPMRPVFQGALVILEIIITIAIFRVNMNN